MTITTKITKVGNSSAIIIPKELMDKLNLKQGEELSLSEIDAGLLLTPYNEKKAKQMDRAREIMRENRNMLRKLAQ